jgi:rhombotail lipoprotein
VQGEKNDTHTMVDAAVYDIASRTLLFRAPGVSQLKARATPVRLEEELRDDRLRGFREAADDLVANLKTELERFTEQVRQERARVQVVRQQGYTGAGSTDLWTLLGLTALGAAYLSRAAAGRHARRPPVEGRGRPGGDRGDPLRLAGRERAFAGRSAVLRPRRDPAR